MTASVTKHHLGSAVLVLALLGGCASERDVFLPVGPARVAAITPDGTPGVRYRLPAGQVVLAPLQVRQDPRTETPRLLAGVRMIVSNDLDPVPWKVDMHDQSVIFGPPVELSPAEKEELDPRADIVINRTGSDILEIPRGKREAIDFFFPMPPPAEPQRPGRPGKAAPITKDGADTQLTLYWRVLAGAEPFGGQTYLYRTNLQQEVGLDSDPGQQFGRLYYDPMYPAPIFFYPPLVERWRPVTLPPVAPLP